MPMPRITATLVMSQTLNSHYLARNKGSVTGTGVASLPDMTGSWIKSSDMGLGDDTFAAPSPLVTVSSHSK